MYHSGNSELEQLEDRHHRFNQKLSELEWDYADMRMSSNTPKTWWIG